MAPEHYSVVDPSSMGRVNLRAARELNRSIRRAGFGSGSAREVGAPHEQIDPAANGVGLDYRRADATRHTLRLTPELPHDVHGAAGRGDLRITHASLACCVRHR